MRISSLLFLLSFLALSLLTSCDPCADTTCLNGGTCIDGTCSCPAGYTGSSCEQQKTPVSMTVTKITVTSFPATDGDGGGWDLSDGADLYVTLEKDGAELYNSPSFFEDASATGAHAFTPGVAVNIGSPTATHVVALYDYDDFDADDYIGGIQFPMYTAAQNAGFPTTLTLTANNGITVVLNVTYSF